MEKATLIGMYKAQIWEATISERRKKTHFQEIISRKCLCSLCIGFLPAVHLFVISIAFLVFSYLALLYFIVERKKYRDHFVIRDEIKCYIEIYRAECCTVVLNKRVLFLYIDHFLSSLKEPR